MRDDQVVKRTALLTSDFDTAVDRAESVATADRTLRGSMVLDCEFGQMIAFHEDSGTHTFNM